MHAGLRKTRFCLIQEKFSEFLVLLLLLELNKLAARNLGYLPQLAGLRLNRQKRF